MSIVDRHQPRLIADEDYGDVVGNEVLTHLGTDVREVVFLKGENTYVLAWVRIPHNFLNIDDKKNVFVSAEITLPPGYEPTYRNMRQAERAARRKVAKLFQEYWEL